MKKKSRCKIDLLNNRPQIFQLKLSKDQLNNYTAYQFYIFFCSNTSLIVNIIITRKYLC